MNHRDEDESLLNFQEPPVRWVRGGRLSAVLAVLLTLVALALMSMPAAFRARNVVAVNANGASQQENLRVHVLATKPNKDLGVAVCIAGQLSRTELGSKVANIISPLAEVTDVDVFAALEIDENGSFTNTQLGLADRCGANMRQEDVETELGSHFVAGVFTEHVTEEVRLQNFRKLYAKADPNRTHIDRVAHVSNVMGQLRHLMECSNLITSHENATGGRYSFVVKLRDNTLALNRVDPAELLNVSGVMTKDCASAGGINDKVMILQRHWLEQTLGSYYPIMRKIMFAKDPDEIADLKSISNASNTEKFETAVLQHFGVPYEHGIVPAAVMPFVDGRCHYDETGVPNWCVVEDYKDCWPDDNRTRWALNVTCQVFVFGGIEWFPKDNSGRAI